MDLVKAKLFIEKINREMQRMQADPDNIARIDIDIFKNYVRELYETCLDDAASAQPVTVAPKVIRQAVSGPKTIEVKEESKASEPIRFSPERVVVAPQSVAQPEPVKKETPKVEAPKPEAPKPQPTEPLIHEPIMPVQQPVVVFDVSKHEPPAPSAQPTPVAPVTASKKVLGLFDLPEAKELSQKLARSPISDLKGYITLNDRLQWPKMLFGGEMAAFDRAIDQLNQFSHFDEAKSYLINNFAEKNAWADDAKIDIAHQFIILVSRRYAKI